MLTKIDLINFQVHRRLTSDISPITVIAGSSDTGKSSIVRALQWLLYNKGSTRDFLRHGASEVIVTAEIDGRTISRSSQHNSYTLDNIQSRVVGRGVPDDIITFLNVLPDNTQSQHDPFYWFNENGSGLVSKIEETFGLKLPAEWVQTCKQEQNQTQRDLKRHEQEEHYLSQEIAVLQQYEQAHDSIVRIDKTLDELNANQNRNDLLQKLFGNYVKFKTGIIPDSVWGLCECLITSLSSQIKLQNLTKKHAELKDDIVQLPDMDRLQNAYDTLQTTNVQLSKITTLIQAHTEAFAVRPTPNPKALLESLQSVLRCSVLFKEYEKRKIYAAESNKLIQESQVRLQSLAGSMCPTCGQPMTG